MSTTEMEAVVIEWTDCRRQEWETTNLYFSCELLKRHSACGRYTHHMRIPQ